MMEKPVDQKKEPVEIYLEEIGKVQPLTEEEKKSLPDLIREGKMEAANRMAEIHLGLVVTIAREYEGRGLHILDLIQEGNDGLIRAVREFDWEADGDFVPFAEAWIHRYIRHSFENACIEHRIPEELISKINLVIRTQREMEQQLGRTPTLEEIARELGYSDEEISKILSRPAAEEDEIPDILVLEEDTGNDTSSDIVEQLRQILESENRLTFREKEVISFRFGLDGKGTHSLEQTAEAFGISRERVRQMERKVFRHRHSHGRAKKIREFYC